LANYLVSRIFQVFCNFVENYHKPFLPNALSAYGIQRPAAWRWWGAAGRFNKDTTFPFTAKLSSRYTPT